MLELSSGRGQAFGLSEATQHGDVALTLIGKANAAECQCGGGASQDEECLQTKGEWYAGYRIRL